MALKSFNCKGCTNLCHLSYEGKVGTYCRSFYEPNHKGIEWQGDNLVCLDYTTDPSREIKEIRPWHEPNHVKGHVTLEEFLESSDGYKKQVQLSLF